MGKHGCLVNDLRLTSVTSQPAEYSLFTVIQENLHSTDRQCVAHEYYVYFFIHMIRCFQPWLVTAAILRCFVGSYPACKHVLRSNSHYPTNQNVHLYQCVKHIACTLVAFPNRISDHWFIFIKILCCVHAVSE